MSGCHNPKDLKLCKHGKDLEYGCSKCYFGDHYDDNSKSGIIDRIKKLEKAFESQSNFNKDQIHINLISNSRMDKIDSIICDLSLEIEKKIIKLNDHVTLLNNHICVSHYGELLEEINKLKIEIKNWEEEFYFLKDKLRQSDQKYNKYCNECGRKYD